MREPGALMYTGEQRECGLRTRHACGTGRLSQGRTGERPGRGTGLGRAGLSGADRRAGGRGLSGAGQTPQALLGHLLGKAGAPGGDERKNEIIPDLVLKRRLWLKCSWETGRWGGPEEAPVAAQGERGRGGRDRLGVGSGGETVARLGE